MDKYNINHAQQHTVAQQYGTTFKYITAQQ
jgi:hypothetical protein